LPQAQHKATLLILTVSIYIQPDPKRYTMKKESLIIIVLLISLSSCSKNEESQNIGLLTASGFNFNFNLRDNNNDRAWESYDSYLSDSTQSPHSPFIRWENGEIFKLEFRYIDSVTVPDISGPIFKFETLPQILARIVESEPDTCATGYIYWNDQRVDTLSLYLDDQAGVGHINECRVITYNRDTIFEQKHMYTSQDYYDLNMTETLIVNIRAKMN
jgi:hypothetical protein